MPKEAERERFNLIMPPRTKKLVDSLQDRTGAQNMTEVFRYALALYDLLSKELADGKELVIRDPAERDPAKAQVRVRIAELERARG